MENITHHKSGAIVKEEDIRADNQQEGLMTFNQSQKGDLNLLHSPGALPPHMHEMDSIPHSLSYPWHDSARMPDIYPCYSGYPNPYMLLCPYNQTDFFAHTYKAYNDNLAMTRTSEFLSASPFFGKLPYVFEPHPFQEKNYLYQHPEPKQEIWAIVKNQEEADLSESVECAEADDSRSQKPAEKNSEQKRKSKMKNETKNIPKNYGKAMISFILSHLDWIQSQFGIQKREQLIMELKKRKNSVNAIVHLKDLWSSSKYAKEFRILSSLFLRKYSYAYIFNSRVSNFSTHIKYKYKLQQALKQPINFSRIKQY